MGATACHCVDAFVGPGCKGNRAAVVLLETPMDEAAMQAAAHGFGEPATAFVQLTGVEGAHPVRWFAPDREIALCGHGTLAAGHVLLAGAEGDAVTLRTGAGREVKIRRLPGAARYEIALPAIRTESRDWPELAAALGSEPAEIRWNPAGYALALFASPQEIAALAPDPEALARLGNLQATASAAGSLADASADITSRVFSRGGREDAATGSAHAALALYWSERLGCEQFAAHQASARGGWFECRIEGNRVWLGGRCADIT
ncbi:PhzF family phenazine biosynthesis protein [Altererythrobacter sp. Z27]|uniref:PhzF family phenazine biosynthesis protein n=1 Tax=Altererythrobacter sp. Z27 TaxID=3461147 RepID=UPI004043C8C3